MQHGFSALAPTACPAALQDRSKRTKRAIVEQPGLINHPTVQGFGIKISAEPYKVSGCLPCKASLEVGKWDGSHCKVGLTRGLNRQSAAAAGRCSSLLHHVHKRLSSHGQVGDD